MVKAIQSLVKTKALANMRFMNEKMTALNKLYKLTKIDGSLKSKTLLFHFQKLSYLVIEV